MTLSFTGLHRWRAKAALCLCLLAPFASSQAAGVQNIPADTTLVVADQNEILQTLIDAAGYQKRLPFKIEFANFTAGPAILEAFRAKALDVALVGSVPPVQAHVAGEQLPIIVGRLGERPAYQLALKPGLEITSLKQLKGLSIAYAEGSARQTFVLAALRAGGLTTKDVTLVPLRAADFANAVRTGQVDVAPLIEPQVSIHLSDKNQHLVPVSELKALPKHLQYLYASGESLKDKDKRAALLAFANAWVDASRWAQAHPKEWSEAYYQKRLGLSAVDAERIIASEGPIEVPPLKDLVELHQEIIDLIYDAGDIPERLSAADEFDFRFDDERRAAHGDGHANAH